jgi:protein-S-isoprenylcysteine O-methyltransferase Ste14
MRGAPHRARVAASGAVLAEQLRLAHTHWTRLRGLLGTRSLEPGDGLWLRPCRQVHMFGMRYAVDAVFLDDRQRVVRTVSGLAPGRVSPRVSEAASVIELPAGTAARLGLADGAEIVIEGEPVGPATAGASGPAAALCNLSLAALYAFFVAVHVSADLGAVNLAIIVQQGIQVVLFLARRPSADTSDRPFDWVVGIVGTFLPLFLRPIHPPGALAGIGLPILVAGVSAAAVAMVFLGRSFGLVAANRGVKLGGAYRVVRHPMYGAYVLSYLGYLLAYPSAWNACIAIAVVFLLNARAIAEERILGREPAYREYLERLRWRFIPFVY